jgi:hypothetical protein
MRAFRIKVSVDGDVLCRGVMQVVNSGRLPKSVVASAGIGTYFNLKQGIWANSYVNWTGRTLSHAVVGGLSSEAQGGEFRHGFYSAALSNGVMHIKGVEGFMGDSAGGWHVAARTAVAALIGGTAAELSGGKFANGAATSAIQHLFNQEASKALENSWEATGSRTLEAGQSRALTEGEIEMAKQVFGDDIDYTKVKIYNKKWFAFQSKDTVMTPNGNIYYNPKSDLYFDDFSKVAGSHAIVVKETFMHEMTHVWQKQQGKSVAVRATFNRRYNYTLAPNKSFASYGIEQQGRIVGDYYLTTQGYKSRAGYARKDYEKILPFSPFK